jgi:putative endonuclease
MTKTYVVYILRTDKNTLYTGQTNDLEKRLKMHKEGKGAKYIRSFKSFELVYKEDLETITEALKREAEIKRMSKKEKEKLVNNLK